MATIEKRVRNGKTTYRARYRDPAGSNEVDEIALGDADVAAELHVGDAALGDQPPHEAR